MTFFDFLEFRFKIAAMRWIFGFQQVGRRALSAAEIESLKHSASAHSAMRLAYGGLAVSIGLLGMVSVVVASGGRRLPPEQLGVERLLALQILRDDFEIHDRLWHGVLRVLE